MPEQTPERPDQAEAEKKPPAVGPHRSGGFRSVGLLLKKYLAAVIGIVAIALTATFNTGLQNLFAGLLPDGWDESGSGIKVVDVRRQPLSGRVLIPDAESAKFRDQTDAREKVNDPEWEARHEWYAVERVTWEVTLVGRHNDPVVITDLRPERIGDCTQRLQDGVLVEDLPAGEGTKIELTTAIDAKVPELTSAEDGTAYFDDGTVTLAKGETVVISIEASSAGPTCRWVLEADYVDNGKRESMTIKAPGGRPFGITGLADAQAYPYTWHEACHDHVVKREDMNAGEHGLPRCE